MSSLRDELQKIYDQRGRLTPALVVETATAPDHPLHPHFEWQDRRAADLYRRQQARELIKSVTITYSTRDKSPQVREVRQWYAVATPAGYQYEPIQKVTTDYTLVTLVKHDMETQWRQLKAKYEAFEEFWLMVQEDLEKAAV